MAEKTHTPDAELFYSLYDGVFRPNIVRLAIKLDLFTPLSERELDAKALSRTISASLEGTERLADYLVSIGLLKKSGKHYSLTPTAQTFLVRNKKSFAGDLILTFTSPEFWDHVLASMKTGEPTSLLERFDEDAWVESYRTTRIISSREMWQATGLELKDKTVLRILDLASGCGIKTFCLAQKMPSVYITCVDSPEVLESAHDLAVRMGIQQQVTLISDNILTIQLGKQKYKICFTGQITHYLTAEQNKTLFSHIYGALVPGGKFIIDVPIREKKLDESAAFLSLVLWANSGGQTYTFKEYEEWLLASGFRSVRRTGVRWIVAEK